MIDEEALRAAEKVKVIARSLDPGAEVYLFGSSVRGRRIAASDIDVLVLTERMDLKYEIMVKVYKAIEEPVELHIVDGELMDWYKRFIPREELVKIP
jgi:predicted nucleotidyltransferase